MGLFSNNEDKKKGQQDYGLFSYMNDEQENDEYSDKELDDYGLEDYEKDEVKKGNEDLWNFAEEELEDDDYYSEDE